MSSPSSSSNHNNNITVQGNDVAFAVHAVIMASITLSQIGMYDTFAVRPPSRRVYILLGVAFTYCAIYIVGTYILRGGEIDYLGFLYVLGSVKIGVTIGKYVPQALLNRSRKSTVGWNVWNVILDLSGGILSLVQLIGDCANMDDWSGVTGNPAKILLAVVTICFDLIFLVQHFVLYVDNDADEKQSYSPLPESYE
jgi:cystinosin